MSVDGVVRYVSEVLARGHALFGDAPNAPERAAGVGLSAAADTMAATRQAISSSSGRIPGRYGAFAEDAETRLEGLGDADERLRVGLHDAAASDRRGRNASGAVIAGAAMDSARRIGAPGTPAERRALVAALRARVDEQRRVLEAARMRDARLAAVVRALNHPRGGAIPRGSVGTSFGTGGSSGPLWRATRPGRPAGVDAGTVRPEPSQAVGRLTRNSSPRECAAALIEQAGRRGYRPGQIRALLSTMLQESGGNPRAMSPNGLWRGLFQQDFSYPGRDDPNTAIAEFLDRLAVKGGPGSPDVWKSVFWLQQAPGAASAEAAYADGRWAYLREIQSQLARATALYDDVVRG